MSETSVTTKPKKKPFRIEGQTRLLLIILIVAVLFFTIVNGDKGFLKYRSVASMGVQLAEIGILALAMMITILVGGINLSINATANLGVVLSGFFLFRLYPPVTSPGMTPIFTQISVPADPSTISLIIGLLIPLLVGLLTGVINGLLVGYIKIPPILATLATMSLFTGLSAGLTKGRTITGFPTQYELVAGKTILGIPLPFILFTVLTILVAIVLRNTTHGFKMQMIGTNETASEFSGINNKAVIMRTYMLSGVLASIAGIIIMSRTMSAAYEYGMTTYVLLTILITVLAGIQGGFGNVFNLYVAMLILQVLSTGFQMLLQGVRGSTFFKDFSWGVLMLIIFIINYFTRRRKSSNQE